MPPIKPLPAYLRDIQEEVEGYARNGGEGFLINVDVAVQHAPRNQDRERHHVAFGALAQTGAQVGDFSQRRRQSGKNGGDSL